MDEGSDIGGGNKRQSSQMGPEGAGLPREYLCNRAFNIFQSSRLVWSRYGDNSTLKPPVGESAPRSATPLMKDVGTIAISARICKSLHSETTPTLGYQPMLKVFQFRPERLPCEIDPQPLPDRTWWPSPKGKTAREHRQHSRPHPEAVRGRR
jgi:hypothetical protein